MSAVLIWSLLSAFAISGVRADGWDEFANNLATDLAPLIALFGEQATKQFLSESLTWVDNFIFCMAPLGILTAVVSAIRVCGSSSLRAFIGRAQEGDGVAEAELCSSTSRNVCELYNNGGIARVFGRPKILEVVWDPDTNDFYEHTMPTGQPVSEPTCGIFFFQEYIRTENGKKEWWEEGKGNNKPESDEEKNEGENENKDEDGNPQTFAPNPNLSLNIGIKKPADWIFDIAAWTGLFLQAAVLVFGIVITYRLQWKKNGNLPEPWACPFTLAGTSLLCLGMFLCALLIEQSTEERKFRRKPSLQTSQKRYGLSRSWLAKCMLRRKENRRAEPKQNASSLHWLQPGNQEVGDQVFDAFAYSDCKDSLQEYVTSYKSKQFKNRQTKLGVWVAICVTIGGFVLQFVGLRAMHSAVSVFQLGATLIMAIIRAGLRARRFRDGENDFSEDGLDLDLVRGHELDWLALRFGKQEPSTLRTREHSLHWSVNSAPFAAKDIKSVHPRDPRIVCMERKSGDTSECFIYGFATELAMVGLRLISEAQKDHGVESQEGGQGYLMPNPACRQFKNRARLARMTSPGPPTQMSSTSAIWEDSHVSVRLCSRYLKSAIEQSAEILLSDSDLLDEGWKDKTSIWWALEILSPRTPVIGRYEGNTSKKPLIDRIFLSVRRSTDRDGDGSRGWRVDLSEIEAILGLWTWSMKRNCPDEPIMRRIISRGSKEEMVYTMLWMEKQSKEPSEHELGVEQESQLHNAHTLWQAPSGAALSSTRGKQVLVPVDREAICAKQKKSDNQSKIRFFGWQGSHGPNASTLNILSVPAKNSLPEMCAQEIFISFLCAAASIIKDMGGSKARWKDSNDFYLVNDKISKVIDAFEESSIGSREDAFLCIIPAMQTVSKLPSMSQSLASARTLAADFRKRGDWEQAEDLLRWSYRVSKNAEEELLKSARAIGELYRWALVNKENDKRRQFDIIELGSAGAKWIHQQDWRFETTKDIVNRYVEVFRTIRWQDPRILQAAVKGRLVEALTSLRPGVDTQEKDERGRTALHWAATRGWDEVVEGLLEIGAEPDPLDNEGRTPLLYACEGGCLEAATLLMHAGASGATDKGRTALHWATIRSWNEVVEGLLEIGAEPDPLDNEGRTPLSYACEEGCLEAVTVLMHAGASLNSRDHMGRFPLSYAAAKGHISVLDYLLERPGVNIGLKDHKNRTALHCAIEGGHVPAMERLLKRRAEIEGADPAGLTPVVYALEDLAKAVAGNKRSAIEAMWSLLDRRADEVKVGFVKAVARNFDQDIMKLLLDQWAGEIKITDEVVKAAAANERSGVEVVALLLDRQANEVKVTEEVVKAAAGNQRTSKKVMALLLDQRADEVKITEEVVKAAAAGNRYCGKEIMRLLLDGRAEVMITEELVKIVAGSFDQGIIKLLVDQGAERVKITEEVVKAAAANEHCSMEVVALLLDRRADEVKVTEEVVKAAAGNRYTGKEVMALLLDRRADEVKVTEEVVKTAAANKRSSMKVMALLLDQRAGKVKVTEEVIRAAVGNRYSGKEVMRLLLDGRAEVVITEELVKIVAGSFDQGIIKLLLDQWAGEIKITEEVVKAAAANERSGMEVVVLLLDRRVDEVKVTEEVVKAAAGNRYSGKEVMRLLLDGRAEVMITEEMVKIVAGSFSADIIQLLDRRAEEVKVTEEVAKTAAANKQTGMKIIAMLLEQHAEKVKVTEEVVNAAAGNRYCGKEIMRLLLDGRAEVMITEELVKIVAGSFDQGIIKLLVDQGAERVKITEEVVKAAAANERSGMEVVVLLLDRRADEVKVTEEVVKAAAGNRYSGKEVMRLLLDGRAEVMITEEMVKIVAGSFSTDIIQLLEDQGGGNIYSTNKAVKAAGNKRSGMKMIAMLLEQQAGKVKVTEEVVNAAAGNRYCGKEIMRLLLDGRAEVMITEELVKIVAGSFDQGIIKLLVDQWAGEIKITEEVVKAAAANERSGVEVAALLLDWAGEVKVTEEVVKAAAGNRYTGKEVMRLLLDGRAEVVITEELVKIVAGSFDQGIIKLLLDQWAGEIKITEEVVKAAAANERSGVEVTALLLDWAGEVKVTEEVVKAAAGNRHRAGMRLVLPETGKEVMRMLLDEWAQAEITEAFIKAVARNFDQDIMELLLDQWAGEIKITDEVVKAAAANERSGVEVVALLLDRQANEVKVTEEVVKAAAGNQRTSKKVMALLLDQRADEVKITEEVVKAAAGNWYTGKEVMALLLDRRADEVKVTEEVVKAAAGNRYAGKKVMALLLDRRADEVKVTEKVVGAALRNRYCGMGVIALLLDRRADEVMDTVEYRNYRWQKFLAA